METINNKLVHSLNMPTNYRVFLKFARKLKKHAKGRIDPKEIEDELISMIRARDVTKELNDIYENAFEEFEPDYEKELEKIYGSYRKYSKIRKGSLGIACVKYLGKRPLKKVQYRIRFKLYYTVRIHTFQNINNFFKCIACLFGELKRINEKSDDTIVMKIPASLKKFTSHSDSLVVYFDNKKLANEINWHVLDVFKSFKVEIQKRKLMGSQGFDFEHEVVEKSLAHSELIARIVASQVVRNVEELVMMNNHNIAKWVRSKVREVKRWDFNQIHKKLISQQS